MINDFGARTSATLAPLLFDTNMHALLRRLIQMGIIMYVVLYALMLQKGYQESAFNRIRVAFST